MGNLGYEKIKRIRDLGIILNKPMVIITKSKKLLKLGDTRGVRPLSNFISITTINVYI